MQPVLAPTTLARAVELTLALQREVARWPQLFRSDALPGLALAIASSAPDLEAVDLLTLGKLAVWMCAFEDYVEDAHTTAEDVEQCIARYEALVCRGNAGALACDPIAAFLLDVLAALRLAPLGSSLWPLFATQLATSLEATRWELGARDLETYVARAAEASFITVVTTAAAMLIGEHRLTAHIPTLLVSQRHAANVVRLANRLATGRGSERTLAQMRDERVNVATTLARLGAAPVTAAFFLHFTDFFVALYAEESGRDAHAEADVELAGRDHALEEHARVAGVDRDAG